MLDSCSMETRPGSSYHEITAWRIEWNCVEWWGVRRVIEEDGMFNQHSDVPVHASKWGTGAHGTSNSSTVGYPVEAGPYINHGCHCKCAQPRQSILNRFTYRKAFWKGGDHWLKQGLQKKTCYTAEDMSFKILVIHIIMYDKKWDIWIFRKHMSTLFMVETALKL